MKLPKFEDKHPDYCAEGYAATNEEPEVFRLMLRNKRFNRVASIASGGELPFFVLLQRAKEVIGIDHSYRSLVVCFLKAIVLNQLGGKGYKELFLNGSYEEVKKVFEGGKEFLPEGLQAYLTFVDKGVYDYKHNNDPKRKTYSVLNTTCMKYLRRETHFIPLKVLDAAARRLDQVTLVHGDITDLKDYAGDGFDLFYASNATGHMNRFRKSPSLVDFMKLVRDGGYVLSADSYGTNEKSLGLPIELKEVKRFRGLRSDWDHVVLQKVEPPKVEAQPITVTPGAVVVPVGTATYTLPI